MSDLANIRVSDAAGGAHAFSVLLPLRDGRKIRVTGRASIGDLGMVGGEVGFSLKKFAKGIAKSKAFRSVMKIAKNPIVASLLPPGISQALAVADGASRLIAGARRGDGRARARLRAAAATGRPEVLEGLRVAAAASGVRLRFSGLAPSVRPKLAARARSAEGCECFTAEQAG
jgi:hypothetical protein